jgi:antitoxin CcdA
MRMNDGFSDQPRPFRLREPKRARKRAANVTVDADILAEAKAMKINLSQTLEDELRRRIREEKARRFFEENREAFDSYNRFIAEHGIWSEKFRTW